MTVHDLFDYRIECDEKLAAHCREKVLVQHATSLKEALTRAGDLGWLVDAETGSACCSVCITHRDTLLPVLDPKVENSVSGVPTDGFHAASNLPLDVRMRMGADAVEEYHEVVGGGVGNIPEWIRKRSYEVEAGRTK